MLPLIVIVGRPNVGKSTLFNALTETRDAIVADLAGVTRDRQYGLGKVGDRPYWVVDTGGIVQSADGLIEELSNQQVEQAIQEADQILFMVDAKAGLTPADELIAKRLRAHQDKLCLVVNKADGMELEMAAIEFHRLGLSRIAVIAAHRKRGVPDLMAQVLEHVPIVEADPHQEDSLHIAIVGRPNVGKSTLVNRILGEDRVIVCDEPGTTRDSIYIPFERRGKKYTLIDTAGIRRRSRIDEAVEKFSILKTLQAVDRADVVVMVLNAQESISEQDMRLLSIILARGSALVLAINKWDGMQESDKEQVRQAMDRRLGFVDFARRYFISALHGTGVGKLYHAIHEAYESATQDISTNKLTRALEKAIEDHQPPLMKGRRIRPRYAHLGGHQPLVIVIHGKQLDALAESYRRYLISYFRKSFKLVGVPIHLRLKSDDNPYSGGEGK